MGRVELSGEGLDHVNIKSRHDALIVDLKWKSVNDKDAVFKYQVTHFDKCYIILIFISILALILIEILIPLILTLILL